MSEAEEWDPIALYRHYQPRLEDEWKRLTNTPKFAREIAVFGWPILLRSNREYPLTAADSTLRLFSQVMPQLERPRLQIDIIVSNGRVDLGPLPGSLTPVAEGHGADDWLFFHVGPWGHCYADLERGRATMIVSPQLAERPDLISHHFLNKTLLNFAIQRGYGMLHASCLVRGDTALLLMAPHNTGKSTTALQLCLNGYQLLSDSMIFVIPGLDHIELVGFPTRRIKLRRDMVAHFPRLQHLLSEEQVRDETKFVVDLAAVDKSLVRHNSLSPEALKLCLLRRRHSPQTKLSPASRESVLDSLMRNSIFLDSEKVWKRNLDSIRPVIARADCLDLEIGQDIDHIVAVVDSLFAKE